MANASIEPKDFYLDVSLTFGGEPSDPDSGGWSFGGQIVLPEPGDTESLDLIVSTYAGQLRQMLSRQMEVEARQAQALAAPFWKKWLGGV